MEERKTICDFPKYTVDATGDVMNSRGQHIKPEQMRNGYLRVSLSNDHEKHKRKSVHRLVAEAFIPNPNKFSQVDHINEIKSDNRVSNLRWCTPLENLKHSHVIEKASEAKFTKIICKTTGEVFESVKTAAEQYGLHHSNIVACCAGRRRYCGGMEWEYVD